MNGLAALRVDAPDLAARPPVGTLDVDGNVVGWIADVIVNLLALCPTEYAEHVWPVSVRFDPTTGRSQIEFSYLPPTRVAA